MTEYRVRILNVTREGYWTLHREPYSTIEAARDMARRQSEPWPLLGRPGRRTRVTVGTGVKALAEFRDGQEV